VHAPQLLSRRGDLYGLHHRGAAAVSHLPAGLSAVGRRWVGGGRLAADAALDHCVAATIPWGSPAPPARSICMQQTGTAAGVRQARQANARVRDRRQCESTTSNGRGRRAHRTAATGRSLRPVDGPRPARSWPRACRCRRAGLRRRLPLGPKVAPAPAIKVRELRYKFAGGTSIPVIRAPQWPIQYTIDLV
jgi:hypothetical protein